MDKFNKLLFVIIDDLKKSKETTTFLLPLSSLLVVSFIHFTYTYITLLYTQLTDKLTVDIVVIFCNIGKTTV